MIRKLQIEHVTHFFPAPEGGDLKVLEDVSFDVGAGEFVSIIGASGSGKTTILRIIDRLLTPTEAAFVSMASSLSVRVERGESSAAA